MVRAASSMALRGISRMRRWQRAIVARGYERSAVRGLLDKRSGAKARGSLVVCCSKLSCPRYELKSPHSELKDGTQCTTYGGKARTGEGTDRAASAEGRKARRHEASQGGAGTDARRRGPRHRWHHAGAAAARRLAGRRLAAPSKAANQLSLTGKRLETNLPRPQQGYQLR